MKEYTYTYIDEYGLLYYGTVVAGSEGDAQKRIRKEHCEDMSIQIWHSSQQISGKRAACLWADKYYLRNKSENELIYHRPLSFLIARFFFLFLTIILALNGEYGWSLFIITVFILTFVRSQKMIVRHDSIMYKKRLLKEIKKKRVDITDISRIIPKAIEFKVNNGETAVYSFICLEKNGEEAVVYGIPDDNIISVTKMATRWGAFLSVPVEIESDSLLPQRAIRKNKKKLLFAVILICVSLLLAAGILIGEPAKITVAGLAVGIIYLVCEFSITLYRLFSKIRNKY